MKTSNKLPAAFSPIPSPPPQTPKLVNHKLRRPLLPTSFLPKGLKTRGAPGHTTANGSGHSDPAVPGALLPIPSHTP